MKKLFITCIVFSMCWTIASAQYQDQKQKKTEENRPLAEFVNNQKTLWNDGWEFSLGKQPAKGSANRVILPHDFQWEQPWTQSAGGARGFKPMCEGWYRKTFVADSTWRGLNVKLDIGGLIYYGDVYVNDKKVASTDYGYVGFEVDMTPYLKWGEENEVKVYASTGSKKGSRWYTGGGLFRDVYLKMENPTHIARHGVYITTKDNRDVNIQVEVAGWHGHDVCIKTRVKDADGKLVGTTEQTMPEHTHKESVEVQLPTVTISDAHLWSIDTPYLYSADVLVYNGSVLVDSLNETFGIRTIEFSPKFGFKLNGKKVFLQGNSGHHDMGALGAACYDEGIERMMRQLKAFGFNCIRCSHNPYSESFARIADRVGLLLVEEAFDKWGDNDYWGGRQPLTTIWPSVITGLVKRDRNRPSVIMWSLGNELQIRENWTGYKEFNDWGVTMYRVMREAVRRWDKTRPTTVGQFPARAGAVDKHDKDFNSYLVPPELAQATEVASLNYQSDKYKAYQKACPDMIIYQSEAEAYQWLGPMENMDRETMAGLSYWGSIEYWGESNRWPKKGWNYSFFSHTMQPYPQAWLLKSAFMPEEPTVHIGVLDQEASESINWNNVKVGQQVMLDHWNFTPNSKQQVYVFTNATQVELVYNGKSLGKQQNTGTGNKKNVVIFPDVDYGNGGTLVAIGRDATGKETARYQLQTAGKAVRLKIEPEPTTSLTQGRLGWATITAVDKNGIVVPSFNEDLTVTVDGAASLYALDNGDHFTNDLFTGVNTKKMRNGRMQVIWRKNGNTGKIILKANAPSLRQMARM